MTTSSRHLTFLLGAFVLTACGTPPWDDPTSQYVQRNSGVTLSAGNAHDANAVTHMNDPWPRYVQDRNIPATGRRMADAVARDCQNKLGPPPLQPVFGQTIGIAGTSAYGGGGGGTGTGTGGGVTGGLTVNLNTGSGTQNTAAPPAPPPPGC
jgi:hypothetical protein